MAGNALHQLILSLSKSEKRHVMLFLRRNKPQSNLLKIYKLLADGKSKADEEIKKIPNNSVLSHYLYEQILSCLTLLHTVASIDTRIRTMMNEAEVLISKSLYPLALNKLDAAVRLAVTHEKFSLELEMIEMKRKVRQRTETLDSPAGLLKEEWERSQFLASQILVKAEHRYYAYRMFTLSRKEAVPRHQEQLYEYEELIEAAGLTDLKPSSSFHKQLDDFNTLGIYYRAKRDFESLYNIRKRSMILLDDFPLIVKEVPGIYLSALNNMVIACFYKNLFSEGFEYIRLLKAFKPKNEDERLKAFVNATSLELSYYHRTADYQAGVKMSRQLEHELSAVETKLSVHNRIALRFNMALLYFKASEFGRCSVCLSNIVRERSDVRVEVLAFSKILQLMVFIERKEQEMLDSLLRSSERYFDKTSRLFHFEDAVLSWIRSIKDVTSISQHQWKSLRKKLEVLKRNNMLKETDDMIGIEDWLKQKLK